MPFYLNGRIGNGGWNPTFVKAIGLLFSEDENSGQELRKLYEEAVAANKAAGTNRILKKSDSVTMKARITDDERKKSKGSSTKGSTDTSREVEGQAIREVKHSNTSSGSDGSGRKPDTVIVSGTAGTAGSSDRKRPKYTDIDMFAGLTSKSSSSSSSSSLLQQGKKMKKSSSSKSLIVSGVSSKGSSGSVPPGSSATSGSINVVSMNVDVKADVDSDGDGEAQAGAVTVEEDGAAVRSGGDGAAAASNCLVCGLSQGNGGNNQLLECNECHSYYHQKCHKPVVTEREVKDPRLVWYCYKCGKRMKKKQGGTVKPAAETAQTTDDRPEVQVLGSTSVKDNSSKSMIKSQSSGNISKLTSSSSATTQASRGLFGMSNTVVKSSNLGSGTKGQTSSAMNAAEKRLQEMKRKANEKRK